MTDLASVCAEIKRAVHHRHKNPIPGTDRTWRDAVGHLSRDFVDANFAALQVAFYEAEEEVVSQMANIKKPIS